MTSLSNNEHKPLKLGLFRRLFAMFYDDFLLIALLMATTALFNAANHGNAIDNTSTLYIPLVLTLFTLTFFFFTWFWTHGGQTLGLKTWQSKMVDTHGGNITWQQASIRFFVAWLSFAAVGIGFIWSLFHKERKTWHDLASNTQLIDLRARD